MTASASPDPATKTVLDPDGKYLTFINTFMVEPDRAEELLEALKDSTEMIFRSKKGFISVNLHLSRDHKRVVNYAQWQTKEDYEAASQTPEVQSHVKELGSMAISYDPVDYDLRYAISAE